jgi:hypothetical protein
MYCWYWQCLSPDFSMETWWFYLTEAGFAVCGQQLSNYGYYAFAIMRLLPGYTVTDKFGALVLLAVFCLMVLGVTELTVKKEIK